MKVFRICSWAIFIIGLLFKILHWPGGSLWAVLGATLLLVHSLIVLAMNAKNQLTQSLMNVAIAAWMVYLLFRVQYWNHAQTVFLIALALTITASMCHVILTNKPKNSAMPFYGVVVLGLLLSSTRAHQVHGFMALNPVLYSKGRTIDYYGWDKQTWFLYLAGKYDEALEANEKALQAHNAFAESGRDYSMGPYFFETGTDAYTILLNRKNQIEQKSWKHFMNINSNIQAPH